MGLDPTGHQAAAQWFVGLMLHRTFVTAMLDVGVDLYDGRVTAHHADPRTTVRYARPARISTTTQLRPGRRNFKRGPSMPMTARSAFGSSPVTWCSAVSA